jgi:DNA repair exonuclease SbcCD ATPase subunit
MVVVILNKIFRQDFAMRNLLTKSVVLMLFGLVASSLTYARDISAEQHAAYEARQKYSQASADYDSYTKEIDDLQKYLVQQQAQLKDLQEKQAAAQQAMEKAKADMEVKDKALNAVWGERDK